MVSSVFIPVTSNFWPAISIFSPLRTRSLNSSWKPDVLIRLMKKLYSVSWKTRFLLWSSLLNSPFSGVTCILELSDEWIFSLSSGLFFCMLFKTAEYSRWPVECGIRESFSGRAFISMELITFFCFCLVFKLSFVPVLRGI